MNLIFNNNYLDTSSSDKSIKIWDRKALNLTKTLNGHRSAVNSVHLTDKLIISGSGDRSIKIWNLATGQCLRTITGHERGIACLQLIADGT